MSKDAYLVIKSKFAAGLHPAKVLQGFLRAEKTGTLTLRDGPSRLILYLNKGCVVFNRRGVFSDEDFGIFLTARGLITRKELRQYESRSRKEKTTAVDMMIARDMLDEEEAELIAREYYWRSAPSIFLWRNGEYTFVLDPEVAPDPEATLGNAAAFILRGILEKYNPGMMHDRLQKRMSASLIFNERNEVQPEQLRDIPMVDDLVSRVRQGGALSEILESFGENRARCLALVFGLLTLGVLKFAVSDEKKYEKVIKRRSDPLSRLYSAAIDSVDRIRATAHLEEDLPEEEARNEAGVKHPPGFPEEDVSEILEGLDDIEGALGDRLSKLLKLKRLKRQLIKRGKETHGGETPLEATSDTVDIAEEIEQPAGGAMHLEDDEVRGEVAAESRDAGDDVEPSEDEAREPASQPQSTSPDAAPGDAFDVSGPISTEADEIPESAKELLDSLQFSRKDDEITDIRKSESAVEEFGKSAITDMSHEELNRILETAVTEKRWRDADKVFLELCLRERDDAQVLAFGGWARYHLPAKDPFAAGAVLIQKAIDRDPALDLPYLLMGRLYMEERDHSMAELYFVRALEVDKNCVEAKKLIKKLYEG